MQDEFGIVFVYSPASSSYRIVKTFATCVTILFHYFKLNWVWVEAAEMSHRGSYVQGVIGQLGGAVLCRFTSTTNSSRRKLRPKINGYLTIERSVRFT